MTKRFPDKPRDCRRKSKDEAQVATPCRRGEPQDQRQPTSETPPARLRRAMAFASHITTLHEETCQMYSLYATSFRLASRSALLFRERGRHIQPTAFRIHSRWRPDLPFATGNRTIHPSFVSSRQHFTPLFIHLSAPGAPFRVAQRSNTGPCSPPETVETGLCLFC